MPLDFFADTSNWLKELFHVEKPIIAMCHLLPLPGDPYYDEEKGLEARTGESTASCSPTNIPFLI